MQTLTVKTPSHQYPIFIYSDALSVSLSISSSFFSKKIALITNETIAALHLEQWQQYFSQLSCEQFSIILPDGEK